MIIETKSACKGVFFLSLEDSDFKRRDETGRLVWRFAINWLKNDISPEQRSYDKETRIWTIHDTSVNRDIVTALNEVFFLDKNQKERA